jgi:hypothetical protein
MPENGWLPCGGGGAADRRQILGVGVLMLLLSLLLPELSRRGGVAIFFNKVMADGGSLLS